MYLLGLAAVGTNAALPATASRLGGVDVSIVGRRALSVATHLMCRNRKPWSVAYVVAFRR